MKHTIFFHWSIMVFALLLNMAGLQSVSAGVEENSLWRDSAMTELDVDFGGTGFHARWRYFHCDCGDLVVQVEQVAPDGVLTGELLMVDGQALLARGFDQQGADIEPLIQAPSLMLQLAYELLNRAQPDGPFAVDKKQHWEKFEKTRNFQIDTGLATGAFSAPWEVKGNGWKADSGKIRFELLFRFTISMPGESAENDYIGFSGDLDYGQQEFPYPESTILDGWRLQWISLNEPESIEVEDGRTLKDLRQQAKAQ